MIVIGHEALESPRFVKIERIEDVARTRANDVVWFGDSYELARHCKSNNVAYAAKISNLKDVILYANLGANYILVDNEEILLNAQKIANEYFFDSKILCVINDENSIENMALLGIDGVIFESALNLS